MSSQPRPSHRPPNKPAYVPIYDRELRAAKDRGVYLTFVLTIPLPELSDDDGVLHGQVLEVDKYDVKVETQSGNRVWLKKSHVVGTVMN